MVSLKMVTSLLLWFLKVQSHDFIDIDVDQSVWRRSVTKGSVKEMCLCDCWEQSADKNNTHLALCSGVQTTLIPRVRSLLMLE